MGTELDREPRTERNNAMEKITEKGKVAGRGISTPLDGKDVGRCKR